MGSRPPQNRPNRPYRPMMAEFPRSTRRFRGTVGGRTVPEDSRVPPELGRMGRLGRCTREGMEAMSNGL
jgi:hypothetical protein